ncbi:MAG: 3-deoxy-D-manno-octulosonic acid transferase [Chitinophagaceae bacterium]|nr:3-deoxy-D-manno-octulosonic acid transferase [Chitinophagaceae bacterium]MCW5904716.1 3-deoxy-D-manno-octulosonic acid transferase [Chitinophagaceae bacterium]
MKILYNIFIKLYPLVAKLISHKNAKAKLWIEGRKNIFTEIQQALKENKQNIVWMHCSSLGEFEQGRPVLEKLKLLYPNYTFLLTFFSPSGYEAQKKYPHADWIFYMPMDSAHNAKKFLDIINPVLVLFVKYEYWYYYLTELNKRKIPLLLISGIIRKEQPFFKWYGGLYRKMLQCFTHIFVQDKNCVELLQQIGYTKNISIGGDTRFDRVLEIADKFEPIELVEKFIGHNKVIVAGSTWTDDDEVMAHYANTHTEVKFIIAPHEIEKERLNECLMFYKNAILFSDLQNSLTDITTTKSALQNPNVLIIDNIGMLSRLYQYATICYVGGGFGDDGVHNVLEAAVFKKPVIFGPEFSKYREAVELNDAKGSCSVHSALELEKILNQLFEDEILYTTTATNAANYVVSKSGATATVIEYIYEKRLLTN